MSLAEENQRTLAHIFPDYASDLTKKQVLNQTELFFHQLASQSFDNPIKSPDHKWRLATKLKKDYSVAAPLSLSLDSQIRPSWFSILEKELSQLQKRARRQVDVTQFGAVGDGQMDCTKAFKRALASGCRQVVIPAGTYLVKEILLPSNIILTGSGSADTILKLADTAPKNQQLLMNKHPLRGNHHLQIEKLTLDWNVERLTKEEQTAAGGITSSALTLAHVRYVLVQNVVIKNPGLHGIDVTAPYYSYDGDGTRSRLGSEFVWLDQIEAYGYGDDGITTHHSQNILISHSYLHHPSGRAHLTGFSNSNGIEVDDGSQHVSLVENRTAYGFGGIEIKAHETSSAASDTQIFGHFSFHDNRSYNFRHIGHHKGQDSFSYSAYGIRGSFLAAYYPQRTNLYQESAPRGLVVSAYQGVVLNQVIVRDYPDKKPDKIAVAIQYRARDVVLNQLKLQNYYGANEPIKIGHETNNIEMVRKTFTESAHQCQSL